MNTLVQPDPGLYIWTIATFLVLVALLAKFAWRPLLEALDRRQESIRKSLDDAQKARQELERLGVESQRILAAARTEADQILSATRSDANRFREELKQKAQTEAAGPEVDLVPTFAFPVPFQVICELLGLPVEDRETFRGLATARFDVTYGGAGTFGSRPRAFELSLSPDGTTWTPALSGEVSPRPLEQSFVLDAPVDAAIVAILDTVRIGGRSVFERE